MLAQCRCWRRQQYIAYQSLEPAQTAELNDSLMTHTVSALAADERPQPLQSRHRRRGRWVRPASFDDTLSQALGNEQRFTQPRCPQTNGMVERFNGRLAQVLKSHRFNNAHDLETTLNWFVWLYNKYLPRVRWT